ncbi:hypothetical protein B0H17DRAFT_1202621 [Mycena rosella]|uniref:Zn(2)-C6 fungal-type domain-containing protein n=1 Tax=Mycena rosella TaxID=1033263 RepID=A0AAD7DDJ8_MYCRO|nr:hypothetical protein B0H17DRAFT_1202621 [Mycena rosella]
MPNLAGTNDDNHSRPEMIGPPPSFYDPHAGGIVRRVAGSILPTTTTQQQVQQVQYPVYPPAVAPSASASNSSPHPTPHPNTHTKTTPPAPKRKRTTTKKDKAAPVPAPAAYSDNSDSDDGFGAFGGGISVGMGGLGVRSKGARLADCFVSFRFIVPLPATPAAFVLRLTRRPPPVIAFRSGLRGNSPGACTHCKKLKMKCDFGPAPAGSANGSVNGRDLLDNTCRRCRAGGHVCIVEGRKPRSAPKGVEELALARFISFGAGLGGTGSSPWQGPACGAGSSVERAEEGWVPRTGCGENEVRTQRFRRLAPERVWWGTRPSSSPFLWRRAKRVTKTDGVHGTTEAGTVGRALGYGGSRVAARGQFWESGASVGPCAVPGRRVGAIIRRVPSRVTGTLVVRAAASRHRALSASSCNGPPPASRQRTVRHRAVRTSATAPDAANGSTHRTALPPPAILLASSFTLASAPCLALLHGRSVSSVCPEGFVPLAVQF